jgi:hypothetical protein
MLHADGVAINSYRDLDVWIVSMDLVDRVLADLKVMPRHRVGSLFPQWLSQKRELPRSLGANVPSGPDAESTARFHLMLGNFPTRSASRQGAPSREEEPPDKKCLGL